LTPARSLDYAPSVIPQEVDVNNRTLLVSVVLLAIDCSAADSQEPRRTSPAALPQAQGRPVASPEGRPATSPGGRHSFRPREEPIPQPAWLSDESKSLDQLLGELEAIRAQQAKLQKKEQELARAIQKKVDEQATRLKRLGLAPASPTRVGTIRIEGNVGKREKEILGLVNLYPGQILPYPELEEARARLVKAGYLTPEVLVEPNELDSDFKNILIRVGDKGR
jgi:hypothetical protein